MKKKIAISMLIISAALMVRETINRIPKVTELDDLKNISIVVPLENPYTFQYLDADGNEAEFEVTVKTNATERILANASAEELFSEYTAIPT